MTSKSFKDAQTRAKTSAEELKTKERQMRLMKDDHKAALERLEEEKKQQSKACNEESKVKLAAVKSTI